MTLASNNSKIAVIGAGSMVASRFCELWQEPDNLIKADLNGSPSIDITDKNSVSHFFANNDFSTAILFSAYTDVDGAEAQRDDKNGLCWKINVDGVKNIVESCKVKSVKLIFISTDFVFDGASGPYSEDDPVGKEKNLVSWYGITKIEGEKEVESLDNFIILRIAYPYRSNFAAKDDLYRKTVKLYKEGKLYPMFSDQTLTPTFADDLLQCIKVLLNENQKGIFHLASPDVTTPYEIARKLVEVFGEDPNVVKKGSIIEFLKDKSQTPRPINGGLKVDKITKLGFNPTNWSEGIKVIFEQSGGNLI